MSHTTNQFLNASIGIVLLLGLSGCASYKSHALFDLPTHEAATFEENQLVYFAAHAFTKKDCKVYLDRDVIAQGYQPVQITITNTSSRPLYFCLDNISLPTVQPHEVATSVHTNTLARVLGYSAASLVLLPKYGVILLEFAITAIVEGFGSRRANKELDADFDNKALQNQLIRPYSSLNGLIFVPNEAYRSDFGIQLFAPNNSVPVVLGANGYRAEALYN